jgi:hypothetical protein
MENKPNEEIEGLNRKREMENKKVKRWRYL